MGVKRGEVISTLVTVIVAVGVSAGIWILANVVFNQARRRWKTFNALVFAGIGFIVGALLAGNHLTVGSPGRRAGGSWPSSGCRPRFFDRACRPGRRTPAHL